MNSFLLVAALLLVSHPVSGKRKAPEAESKIHDSKTVLVAFHQYDADPQYIEAEAAYHRAAADLEDYENGDPSISLERVNNDAWELWMDLAPFRDSGGVAR